MQNTFIFFLLSFLATLSLHAQDIRIKNGQILVGKSPIAKFIERKIPVNRINYDFVNIHDTALFKLEIVKKEYWLNGPYEEFYRMSGKGIDSAIYISYTLHPTIEDLAALIVQSKIIRNNRLDTAALQSFAQVHSLHRFNEKKANALKVLAEKDSSSAVLPALPEIVFDPPFEQNTILRETDYSIIHKDRKSIGYLRMKELDMGGGTKDYRISFLNPSKFEAAVVTYRQNTGYKAKTIYVRRNRDYDTLESEFTADGLQKATLYLIKKGIL